MCVDVRVLVNVKFTPRRRGMERKKERNLILIARADRTAKRIHFHDTLPVYLPKTRHDPRVSYTTFQHPREISRRDLQPESLSLPLSSPEKNDNRRVRRFSVTTLRLTT